MKKKKALTKWRKRYCILDGPILFYYDVYVPGAGDDNVYRGSKKLYWTFFADAFYIYIYAIFDDVHATTTKIMHPTHRQDLS